MLPRDLHSFGQVAQSEGGGAMGQAVVALLPGDAVENEGRKLVCGAGEVGVGDAAKDGASGEFHDCRLRNDTAGPQQNTTVAINRTLLVA